MGKIAKEMFWGCAIAVCCGGQDVDVGLGRWLQSVGIATRSEENYSMLMIDVRLCVGPSPSKVMNEEMQARKVESARRRRQREAKRREEQKVKEKSVEFNYQSYRPIALLIRNKRSQS